MGANNSVPSPSSSLRGLCIVCTFTLLKKKSMFPLAPGSQEEVETWNRATPADQLPCDQERYAYCWMPLRSWGCLLPSNSWLIQGFFIRCQHLQTTHDTLEQKVFLVFSFIFQLNAFPAPPQGNQMGQDETTVRQAAEGMTRKEHPFPSVFFI